ncbi:MAG: DEAD/DEAH box helicase, partial [Anaerolineales bacterium]|nr:DEAD/DEAH box helicase [Anaerolineales bacterium]
MLSALLDFWKQDEETAPNLVAWQATPPRAAQTHPFPNDMPESLRDALSSRNISLLYSHQLTAWTHARAGLNLILATGTASGKTLAYNLPVLAKLIEDSQSRALYLFPTKALTQDQQSNLESFQSSIANLKSAIYDGDTPQSHRPVIRKTA